MLAETIVLVHGLYMNGLDMVLLGRRLQRAGFTVRRFSCHTLRSSPIENAGKLHAFSAQIQSPVIHYVCHSLGGLVVRHLFHLYPERKPGRVVTLGTPHSASSAAAALNRIGAGKSLLGKSTERGLDGDVPGWPVERELGVIAGSLRMGLGLLLPGIPKPSDGTVAVSETRVDGMTDHIVLPVSHFGLLVSKTVARQTIHFLRHGNFRHTNLSQDRFPPPLGGVQTGGGGGK